MPVPVYDPDFIVSMKGQAISTFSSDENIHNLVHWLKENKWRGQLSINFPGNGGISAPTFTETKRMTESMMEE